jgi:hypothetical protein
MSDVSSPSTGAKGASWRDLIPIHPAADLFPLMPPDELRALGEDIVKNGLTNSIALWRADPKAQAQLLDGRNRLDAIELATGSPVEIGAPSLMAGKFLATDKVIELDGRAVNPLVYVFSANIHRRHLNVEQRQHAFIAIIALMPESSDRQIAAMLGVSHHTVASARARGEDVGRIAHVETHTDSKGRKQPARKKRKTETTTKSPPAPPANALEVEASSPEPLPVAGSDLGETEGREAAKRDLVETQKAIIARLESEIASLRAGGTISGPTKKPQSLLSLLESAISAIDAALEAAWPAGAKNRERERALAVLANTLPRLRSIRDIVDIYENPEEAA